MSTETINIRAVAFREGDVWVVQGIEYDIATQTSDPSDIPTAFMQAITEYLRISQQLGKPPLANIGPAPERFREMYERAESEVRPVRPMQGPRLGEIDIRLVGRAA